MNLHNRKERLGMTHLNNLIHMRHQSIHSHFQQHHQAATHIFPHFMILVRRQMEQILDECIDVNHQHLRPIDNKLVDASNGMRPNLWDGVFEELQKFRYHDVQWPIQCGTVQCFSRIFADLLQCTKCTFANMIVLRIEHIA